MINLMPQTDTYVYFLIVFTFLISPYLIYKVNSAYKKYNKLSKSASTSLWLLHFLNIMTISNAMYWSMWAFTEKNIYLIIFGIAMIIFGIGALFLSLREFNSFKKMSGLEANKVVSTGIYRYSRNPQYVGAFLIIIGISMIQVSTLALILTLVFFMIVNFSIVPGEEKYLTKMLGEEYVEYKKSVGRWL
jgi:protein-S-isoprenylcysteine O-methyltransferase Ste14